MNKFIVLLLCSVFGMPKLWSQYRLNIIPRKSPDKKVFQKIAYTDVEVSYGSPQADGRKIWGDLIPYDKVWRTGANDAPTLSISHDIELNGQSLSAGTYAFFLRPNRHKAWELIINSKAKQWGAFRYESDNDVLVVSAYPSECSDVETFTIELEKANHKTALLRVAWANKELSFAIETNIGESIKAVVEKEVKDITNGSEWVAYLQAAEYLLDHGEEEALALEFLNKAMIGSQKDYPTWEKQFYPVSYLQGHILWTKAKHQASNKNLENALKTVKKMKKLRGPLSYYSYNNEYLGMDAIIDKWKNQ